MYGTRLLPSSPHYQVNFFKSTRLDDRYTQKKAGTIITASNFTYLAPWSRLFYKSKREPSFEQYFNETASPYYTYHVLSVWGGVMRSKDQDGSPCDNDTSFCFCSALTMTASNWSKWFIIHRHIPLYVKYECRGYVLYVHAHLDRVRPAFTVEFQTEILKSKLHSTVWYWYYPCTIWVSWVVSWIVWWLYHSFVWCYCSSTHNIHWKVAETKVWI